MNVDNVKSQMRKGMLEYCILLLLHREPSYASDIIQNLKEAKLIVVEGTLYPLLTRLKNDDLLAYEWVESTQGPPRKYYTLTDQGRQTIARGRACYDQVVGRMLQGFSDSELDVLASLLLRLEENLAGDEYRGKTALSLAEAADRTAKSAGEERKHP